MRSVRISQDLYRSIREGLEKSYFSRLEDANNKLYLFGMQVYESLFPENERKLATELTKKWVSEVNELHVWVNTKLIVFPMSNGVLVPAASLSQRYYSGQSGAPHQITLDPTISWHVELSDAIEKREALVAERDNLVTKMTRVVNECRSTKQLAAVWPSFVDYVSEDERKKLYSPITRSSVKKAQQELALDSETCLLLMKARMLK